MNDIAKNAAHECETLLSKEFQGYSQTRADYAEKIIASHIAPLHAEITKLRAAIEHLMAERRRTIRVLGDYDDSDDRPLDSLVIETILREKREKRDERP